MFSDTGSFASSGPFMGFVDNKNKKFSSKDSFYSDDTEVCKFNN